MQLYFIHHTENDFRDQLVLQMINLYGKNSRGQSSIGPISTIRSTHKASFVFPIEQRSHCQYCYLKGEINWTLRKCKDSNFQPALCQVQGRDCYLDWHKSSFVTGFERTHLPRTQQEDTLFTITR